MIKKIINVFFKDFINGPLVLGKVIVLIGSRLALKNGGFVMEKIIAKVIEKMITQLSPQLRITVEEAVRRLEETSKQTKNPWDDILVMILKVAMGLD